MAGEHIYIEETRRRHERRSRVMEKLTGTAAALLMIGAAVLALVLTNVGFHEPLHEVMELPLGFYIGDTFVGLTLELLVNDLLMALFFLMIGCELKYEMTVGALAQPKQAILPMVAALGGVAGPALIYCAFNYGTESLSGWAIPTATDIAFALAVMSLFGTHIPATVKVFFSTLAIADDMVAIVVIALFYSTELSFAWLAGAVAVVLALVALNRAKVFKLTPYLLLGCVLWVCFYNSGIHATLAGVVLAFTLPVKTNVKVGSYAGWVRGKAAQLEDAYSDEAHILSQHEVSEVAGEIAHASHRVTPPLQRLEHSLTFFVNFIVLPVFAFVNAQVHVAGADFAAILTSPVTLGVWVGLVVGKPVGIMLTTFVLVKFCKFPLPAGATWGHLLGVGMLAGIGFTMAILVGGLAFTDPTYIMEGKVGILLGTFTAAILGLVYMFVCLRVSEKRTKESLDGGASR